MPNMGYCRFENTYTDLLDCLDHIYDEDLSETEERYRKRIMKAMLKFSCNYEEDEIQEILDEKIA